MKLHAAYPILPHCGRKSLTVFRLRDCDLFGRIADVGIGEVELGLLSYAIEQTVGLPAFDLLRDGPGGLVNLLARYLENRKP